MASKIKAKKMVIGGMTCAACQSKIQRRLQSTAGVKSASVSYRDGTAEVTYDEGVVTLLELIIVIEKLDYSVLRGQAARETNVSRTLIILAAIAALYFLLRYFDVLTLLVPSQLADMGMGYGMLFVIGLLTSIHCIAMCDGINLSQSLPRADASAESDQKHMKAFIPALLYNLGRVISYTVIGFILGFAGLIIGGGAGAGLPIIAQAVLKALAGLIMIVMGINMFRLFPFLRKLTPRLPNILSRLTDSEKLKHKGPLIVGLLNGFMPCGPLQSMQIVALASVNPLAGGLSMLMFSLGTTPLMLGLGSLVSALGKRFAARVTTVGAVLVVVLGLAMLSQGFMLWGASGVSSAESISVSQSAQMRRPQGANEPPSQAADEQRADAAPSQDSDVQIINSTLSARRYPDITVKAGTPVKWIIDAPRGSITGCNYTMYIGEYDIEHEFDYGENIIEFTPTVAGKFQYTCWMGMIRATITVEA